MAIRPSKGNGFEWDRGPWHVGKLGQKGFVSRVIAAVLG